LILPVFLHTSPYISCQFLPNALALLHEHHEHLLA
jgi:hypothetical protein